MAIEAAPPRPAVKRIYSEWVLLLLNFWLETNRMEAFVAVYLKLFQNWTYVQIGWLSLAMNLAAFAFQTPVGDLLDKTRDKKLVTIVACVISAVTTTSITWTRNFAIVMVFKSIEGIAASVIVPAQMSLILGVVPVEPQGRVDRAVADNELASRVGSVLLSFAAGAVALVMYPNVAPVFYLFGAAFLVSALVVMLLPAAAIDHDRARNSREEETAGPTRRVLVKGQSSLRDLRVSAKADEGKSSRFLARTASLNQPSAFIARAEKEDDKGSITYRELVSDPNIACLALVTMLYHLANAGNHVLATQLIASRNLRLSLVFAAAVMTTHFLSQAVMCYLVGRLFDRFTVKSMMLGGMGLCVLRSGLLALLAWRAPDKFALLSTQVLDGFGAGIFDTLIRVATKRVTKASGRFGVTFAFIITCWQVGHGFSIFLSEAIVQYADYSTAFATLGCISAVTFVVFLCGVEIPPDDEEPGKSQLPVVPAIPKTPSDPENISKDDLESGEAAEATTSPSPKNVLPAPNASL